MSLFPALMQATRLLIKSNVFMTFPWYGHLRTLNDRPVHVAALASWGMALFEYLLQVPGNRVGFTSGISLAQLQIRQEVITPAVFVPFVMMYMDRPFKSGHVWAGLCVVGAVYFIFRG